MHIDIGLAVIVGAVLIFYLRLIIIQRQRVKQVNAQAQASSKKKKKAPQIAPVARYSILSQNKRDWIIAGAGVVLMIAGIILNRGIIPHPVAHSLWWLPLSIGIVAFSWGFK